MLGTTCVGTVMPTIGLFTVCLSTFYHLKHAFCLFLVFLLRNKLMWMQWCRSQAKNVAFFFSAITRQILKNQKKKKADEEDEDSDDNEHFPDSSQVASSTNQGWVTSHPTIVNQKLCPSVNYWIALTTPNGASCNPIVILCALLECRVDVTVNQVTKSLLTTVKVVQMNSKFESRTTSSKQ